jgi:FKBP-type peptidyl-prolyl cis-trans isomerase
MYLRIILLSAIALLIVSCASSDKNGIPDNMDMPQTFMDSVSYSLGKNMALQMNGDSIDINIQYFAAGYMDGKDSTRNQLLNEEEIAMVNQKFQFEVQQRMDKRRQQQQLEMQRKAEENQGIGQTLLEDTKNNPEWSETSSGLLYKKINDGTGEKAKISDVATIHMIGKLPDGSQFENTYELQNGEPVEVPVYQMVPGFQEAITMLNIGAKYDFVVPPAIAFGEQGIQGTIPPNSPVLLTIELVSVADGGEEYETFKQQMNMMQQGGPQGN